MLRRYRPHSRASRAALLLGLAYGMQGAGLARAGAVACVKKVSVDLAHNGVVAPGNATAACAVGPVWTQVAPVEMQPAGSQPNGFLYLAYRTPTNAALNNDRLLVGVDVGDDSDLSAQDSVALLFDADGDKKLSKFDFVIRIQATVSGAAPITNGVNCSQPIGGVLAYFQFDGANWNQVSADDQMKISNAMVGTLASRYEPASGMSPGVHAWNLELDMPRALVVGTNTYFNFQTAGFGLGAYFYVDKNDQQSPQQGTVLRWPDTLPPHVIDGPVIGNLDPTLEPDWSKFATVNLGDVCLDVNFNTPTPWAVNGSPAKAYDHRVIRPPADNTFSVTYHYQGPGTVPGGTVNNGTVELSLMPFTATSGIIAALPYWVQSVPTTAPQFNTDVKVDLLYKNANRPPSWAAWEQTHGPIAFVCGDVVLKGFTHDEDTSNDKIHNNLNYFTTSEYTQTFTVSGDDVPGLKPGQTGELFLRFAGQNDPANGPPTACGYGVGTSRWTVTNAGPLCMSPVAGDPTLFRMMVEKGKATEVGLRFVGQPLPYTPYRGTFNPATDKGAPNLLKFPARPGQVMTVLAFGEIDVDGAGPLPSTSAAGRVLPAEPVIDAPRQPSVRSLELGGAVPKSEPRASSTERNPYLLPRGRYEPTQYAGALIGSFDDFRHAFVIGRASSFIVPAEMDHVSFAVNWERERYGEIVGSYEIAVIAQPLPPVPTHTTLAGDATGQIPRFIDHWKVLTSLNVYSYYKTSVRDPRGFIRSETLNPINFAHFSIFDSHAK